MNTLHLHCASCGLLLATLTVGQPAIWHHGRLRLVMRRRFVQVINLNDDPAGFLNPADYRPRFVSRDVGTQLVRVTEAPYTCDSDACMNALGTEWERPDTPAALARREMSHARTRHLARDLGTPDVTISEVLPNGPAPEYVLIPSFRG